MCNPTPELGRHLITVDITADGKITCWTASKPDGEVVEDWRLVGQFTSAAHSHTWEADGPAYLVIRDILRFLTEDDWQPGTVV
jgi:hypothetical protein